MGIEGKKGEINAEDLRGQNRAVQHECYGFIKDALPF